MLYQAGDKVQGRYFGEPFTGVVTLADDEETIIKLDSPVQLIREAHTSQPVTEIAFTQKELQERAGCFSLSPAREEVIAHVGSVYDAHVWP